MQERVCSSREVLKKAGQDVTLSTDGPHSCKEAQVIIGKEGEVQMEVDL